MKKRYRVDPTRTLLHDGQRYEGGQTVLLDEDAAQTLLQLGAILEAEPEPEQDSQTAPIESETDTEPDPTTESRRRGRPRRS